MTGLLFSAYEMTCFGMNGDDFKDEITSFKNRFLELQYCFKENEFGDVAASLFKSLK
jgi:hypothetical protein